MIPNKFKDGFHAYAATYGEIIYRKSRDPLPASSHTYLGITCNCRIILQAEQKAINKRKQSYITGHNKHLEGNK